MSIIGERYFKMSNATFCYGLTPIQFSVYSYLRCCAGNKDKCWPSMKTIAANCNCSATAARSAIDELERCGFIARVATFEDRNGIRRQTSNTYYIHDLPPLPRKTEPDVVFTEVPKEETA